LEFKLDIPCVDGNDVEVLGNDNLLVGIIDDNEDD